MKCKYFLSLIALTAISWGAYAQDYAVDALRFSQYQFGSSARVKALGNAQTALGGDISSIGGNPAGLGLFTRSELSFTPEIMNYSSTSNYFDRSTDASRGKFDINNLGAVFVLRLSKPKGAALDKGALSLNIGLGYNKTADFGNKLVFSGTNTQNSIADFYADVANNSTGSNLAAGSLADAAYESNLINYNNVYSRATDNNPFQNEMLIRKGSLSEFNIAAGLNIGNKLYLGSSIGILGINYSSDNTFTETGTLSYSDNNGNYQENYSNNYYQRFEAKGTGFNAKLGIIFRPNQYLRLGANVQTPNWYNIEDHYSESLKTNLSNNPYFTDSEIRSETAIYDFSYDLRTPAKFSLGATLLESKLGFITGNIEFADYSSIKLKEKPFDDPQTFVEDNRYMVNNYKNTVNYKVGAEVKASPQIMLRAGYSYFDSPIENIEQDLDIKTYSLGGGYRSGNFTLDLAYQNSVNNSSISPYKLNNRISPVANAKTTTSGVFITVGTRF